MKSWETTLGGILNAVGIAVLGFEVVGAEPLPTWVLLAGTILASVGGFLMGSRARDNNKSSERVKIK